MPGSHVYIENLTKTFGSTTAVSSLSLTITAGTTLVLLGESGCGKTTTLKMINRLIEPTSGRVEIDGTPIASTKQHLLRRHIGYVRQEGGLFPHYSVADNVAVVPRLLGMPASDVDQRIDAALERSGLNPSEFRDRTPTELSGGEGQRVAIARALAAEPPLLLMDEPYSALDPMTRRTVRQTISRRIRELGTTTVVVTHDVSEAVELADVICLIDNGRILQTGPPSALLFEPVSERVRSFFDVHRFETELRAVRVREILDEIDREYPAPDSASPADGAADDSVEAGGTGRDAPPTCDPDMPLYDAIDACRRSGTNRFLVKSNKQTYELSISDAIARVNDLGRSSGGRAG